MTASTSTVLIVADESPRAERYQRWLDDSNTVSTATDANDVSNRLTGAMDVVLLGHQVPSRLKESVLDRVQNEGFDCQVAVVTRGHPGGVSGADEYLELPVTVADLRATIERLSRRTEYTRQLRDYFAIVSEVSSIEGAGLGHIDSSAYEALMARKETLELTLDGLIASFEGPDFDAAMRRIESGDTSVEAIPMASAS